MNKKVLVIGGSGFIGTRLCQALLAAGYRPVVFDRVAPSLPDCEFHQGDMVSVGDLWQPLLQDAAAVFHLAWSTKPQSANDSPYYDLHSNVLAGLHFLDGLVRLPKPPRLLFVSTGGAIYGPAESLPITEAHPTRPINAYGISKLAFEQYLALYHRLHGLDYLCFRPGNPYGEGQDPAGAQGAVAVFLGRLLRGEKINIWGDGGVIRDYLYVGDLVDALVRGLDYRPGDDAPRVFNLGSGEGCSLNELLAVLARVTGRAPEVSYTDARKADASAVVLDSSLAQRELGWALRVPFDEGIARTWAWLQAREVQR